MRASFLREDAGQVIVIVGAAMTVLLASLALAVDWGYGLAVRRAMQNSSDAAALGVGKVLAISTIVINGQLRFLASDAQLWQRADALVQANRGLSDTATFTLEYGDDALNWTASLGSGSTAWIPDDTVYVRVKATTRFDTLVAAVIGNQGSVASASARVRLSGAETSLDGYILPLARHFGGSVFNSPCAAPCADPTTAQPVQLWDNQGSGGGQYGQFGGFLDFSRFSHEQPPSLTVGQLLGDDAWDQTGSPSAGTPLKANAFGRCGGNATTWDTRGNEADNQQNEVCSLPNWAFYGFEGTLSLTSDYTAVTAPRQAPTAFSRASRDASGCELDDAAFERLFGFRLQPRAACDRGDWVETALGVSVGLRDDALDAILANVATHGGSGALSSKLVPVGGKSGQPHGKALTVLVLLWDCGEEWANSPRRWFPIPRGVGSDCTNPPTGASADTPNRIHLMAMAPFTVYEGLVTRQQIYGYWGGGFGEVPPDAPRPLWVLTNTAYLVPDED